MNKEVDDYIKNSQEDHQKILSDLRKLILLIANVKEQFKWSRPVYASEKDFCYLLVTKKYVTLGFFEFDKVVTNKDRIEGTGKSMRHVKLKRIEEIEELDVQQMLVEVLS